MERRNGSQQGKIAKDLREEKGEDLGGSEQGKGGKDLREEREKIWGKKALGGKGEK